VRADDRDRCDRLKCNRLMVELNLGKEVALDIDVGYTLAGFEFSPRWVGSQQEGMRHKLSSM
jgi:hypothetical protein